MNKINIKEKEKASRWENLQEEWKKEEEFKKNHKVLGFLMDSWVFLRYRLPRIIRNSPKEVKWGWQRARRGYSDADAWSLDWYLIKILPPMLKKLRDDNYGCPSTLCGKGVDDGMKQWKKILDNILYTFDTAAKVLDDEVILFNSRTYDRQKMEYERVKLSWKPKVLTKREVKKYEKGWRLFQKYFFSLWD
jgi:hypothetical protein